MDAETIAILRRERAAVHQAFLAVCCALGQAAVHAPGTLPDLLASYKARYDERAGLDLLLATYDPQVGLFDDLH